VIKLRPPFEEMNFELVILGCTFMYLGIIDGWGHAMKIFAMGCVGSLMVVLMGGLIIYISRKIKRVREDKTSSIDV